MIAAKRKLKIAERLIGTPPAQRFVLFDFVLF